MTETSSEATGNRCHPSLYHDMPVKMTQVQLGRHARGKDLRCFLLPAAYVLIAGRAVLQAVLVAT